MTYVTGMVAAVPIAKKDAFVSHAEVVGSIFKEHGALRCVDCWGEDVPGGEVTSFPMAVKAEADEAIVFSWIEWPSKATADAGMAAIMEDPRMSDDQNPMPFDGKRMIFGGFKPLLDL